MNLALPLEPFDIVDKILHTHYYLQDLGRLIAKCHSSSNVIWHWSKICRGSNSENVPGQKAKNDEVVSMLQDAICVRDDLTKVKRKLR